MATEGNKVTGEDRQGRGGDGNPPITQASKDIRADNGSDSRVRGLRKVAQPCLRDTAADDESAGALPRKSNSADSARTENGKHPHRDYVLLAPEDLEGIRANAGDRARGDGHEATAGPAEEGRTETPTEDETGQCALQARGMQDHGNEAQIPPDWSHDLNVCDHPG